MAFVADFHIHSPYSRAVSKEMTLENLDRWAKIKGIKVLGTGDFTHPAWVKEMKSKLEPLGNGLFRLKKEFQRLEGPSEEPRISQKGETLFILTVEVSSIYSKNGRVRKVHSILFAPDFATMDKINANLGWIGNIKSDGRPILGLDAKELLKIALNASEKCLYVPAHCLLPDTILHTKGNLVKKIKDIQVGDLVFTHKNRWRRTEKVLTRRYKGKVYTVKPYYFREGLATTPEHPFYVIKTKKNCSWNNGICKPQHDNSERCKHKYFESYKPQWITADRLEVGDVLIYPRFLSAFENHSVIEVKEMVDSKRFTLDKHDRIVPHGTRITPIQNVIAIDKDFCRLAGYYVAEGCTNGRDAISFTFHQDEHAYIEDVKELMQKVWGFEGEPKARFQGNGVELIFYSKTLSEVFAKLFYHSKETHNASTKSLQEWMLGLMPELQAEIIRGWWRGDKGYTSSQMLMNQAKIIFLRLGIIPSIYVDKSAYHRKRGNHFIGSREVHAQYDNFAINRLSFFEDPFRLLEDQEFKHFKDKSKVKHGWIDANYAYLPIRNIEIDDYEGDVYNLEVEKDNSYVTEFTTIHNCWTPWFSIFGSMSGFDTLEEAFEELTPHVHAIETGLSSSPAMNWRLSKLDNITLISNSDSHSLQRIGREANVFDGDEISYDSIANAIRKGKRAKEVEMRLVSTVEFFPEEGKYHYDGHRACKTSLHPEDTKRLKGLCPACARKVTVGVLSRVEALADRPEGFKPPDAIPFKSMVTLDKIIGDAIGVGETSKAVRAEYKKLIEHFGNEFSILLEVPLSDLAGTTLPEISEGIRRMREGKVKVEPGYDGEYGKIQIFEEGEQKTLTKQTAMF